MNLWTSYISKAGESVRAGGAACTETLAMHKAYRVLISSLISMRDDLLIYVWMVLAAIKMKVETGTSCHGMQNEV